MRQASRNARVSRRAGPPLHGTPVPARAARRFATTAGGRSRGRSLRRGCARRACRRSSRPGCAPSSRSCRAAGAIAWLSRPRASSSSTAASAAVSDSCRRRSRLRRSRFGREEAAQRIEEHRPRGLAFEQDVVGAFQRHEAGARNRCGEATPLVERHGDVVAACMTSVGTRSVAAMLLTSTCWNTSAFVPPLGALPSAARDRSTTGAARACRPG